MTATNNMNNNKKSKAIGFSIVGLTVLVVITLLALRNSDFSFANASFEVYIPFLFHAFPKKSTKKTDAQK